jgi:hypothetical protein
MRYKIGDKVIVREDLIINNLYVYEHKPICGYETLLFNTSMAKYRGKLGKIVAITDGTADEYFIKIDGHGIEWYFNNAMLRSPSGLNNIIKLRKENQQ